MVKLIIPSYLVSEQDKIYKVEYGNAVIICNSNLSVAQTLITISKEMPKTFSNIIKGEEISKSIIIAYNNTLLNYKDLNKITTTSGDTLELLIQFAGG